MENICADGQKALLVFSPVFLLNFFPFSIVQTNHSTLFSPRNFCLFLTLAKPKKQTKKIEQREPGISGQKNYYRQFFICHESDSIFIWKLLAAGQKQKCFWPFPHRHHRPSSSQPVWSHMDILCDSIQQKNVGVFISLGFYFVALVRWWVQWGRAETLPSVRLHNMLTKDTLQGRLSERALKEKSKWLIDLPELQEQFAGWLVK